MIIAGAKEELAGLALLLSTGVWLLLLLLLCVGAGLLPAREGPVAAEWCSVAQNWA
jgi:hypothetical protein